MTLLESLTKVGRESGHKLIIGSMAKAKANKQMEKHMVYVCEVAAIHILATIALNENIQTGCDLDEIVKDFSKKIKSEVQRLRVDTQVIFRNPSIGDL